MKEKKIICEICGVVIEESIGAEIAKNGRVYGIGCNNPDPLNYNYTLQKNNN